MSIEYTVTLNATVDSFNATQYVTNLAATLPGVAPANIGVTVMAGSVLVRTFILATVDVGTAAVAELERFDEATLTTVIGVPVAQVRPPIITMPPPAAPPMSGAEIRTVRQAQRTRRASARSRRSATMVGAVAGGGVLAVCIALCGLRNICRRLHRKKSAAGAQRLRGVTQPVGLDIGSIRTTMHSSDATGTELSSSRSPSEARGPDSPDYGGAFTARGPDSARDYGGAFTARFVSPRSYGGAFTARRSITARHGVDPMGGATSARRGRPIELGAGQLASPSTSPFGTPRFTVDVASTSADGGTVPPLPACPSSLSARSHRGRASARGDYSDAQLDDFDPHLSFEMKLVEPNKPKLETLPLDKRVPPLLGQVQRQGSHKELMADEKQRGGAITERAGRCSARGSNREASVRHIYGPETSVAPLSARRDVVDDPSPRLDDVDNPSPRLGDAVDNPSPRLGDANSPRPAHILGSSHRLPPPASQSPRSSPRHGTKSPRDDTVFV